ncbi:MAG: hypothetical protein ACM3PZ_03295 [Bacillota bacterium]
MKKPLDYRTICDEFSKIETFLGQEPDEDRCQEALMGLEKMSGKVKKQGDISIADDFQSLWLELSRKIKDRADCKTFLDSKREIESNLNALLEPDLA